MNRIPIPLTPDSFKPRAGPGSHAHAHAHDEAQAEMSSVLHPSFPSSSSLSVEEDHEGDWADAQGLDADQRSSPPSASPSGAAASDAASADAGDAGRGHHDDEDEPISLEDQASVVTAILKPVAITMVLVIALVYILNVAQAPTTRCDSRSLLSLSLHSLSLRSNKRTTKEGRC